MSYFGDKEILEVSDGIDGKSKRIKVKYTKTVVGGNGATEEIIESFDLPLWEFEQCVTDYQADERYVKEKRALYVKSKMWDLFRELDIRTEEINTYINTLVQFAVAFENTAVPKAFGVETRDDIRLKSHWEDRVGASTIVF